MSARVANANYLQEIRDRVGSILEPKQVQREGETQTVTEGFNIASARAELKEILQSIGYDPGEKRGTIQDLSSDQRLNLQLKQNVAAAQGYGDFLQGQSDGALAAFPAQELFRAEDREEPRDWQERWSEAGGQFYDGRMIATKDDPVWEDISAFGTPWPPFDFNSGMWVRDIDRAEAEQLGVIEQGEVVKPTAEDFNATLQASVANLDPEMKKALEEGFGDDVDITGGMAKWSE